MYELAPPGRGYAYGETIPIFIFSSSSAPQSGLRRLAVGSRLIGSLLADAGAGAPDRVPRLVARSLLIHDFFLPPPERVILRRARFTGSRTIDRHCCLAAPSRCSRRVQPRPSAVVARSRSALRRSFEVVPGKSVQHVPTRAAWWASLDPVAAIRRTCAFSQAAREARTRPA